MPTVVSLSSTDKELDKHYWQRIARGSIFSIKQARERITRRLARTMGNASYWDLHSCGNWTSITGITTYSDPLTQLQARETIPVPRGDSSICWQNGCCIYADAWINSISSWPTQGWQRLQRTRVGCFNLL